MLLWDVLARSSAVLVVACLASTALRGRSASLRHAVWVLGIAGALAIAPLSWVLPTWHVPLVPAFTAPASAVIPAPAVEPAPAPAARSAAVASTAIVEAPMRAATVPAPAPPVDAAPPARAAVATPPAPSVAPAAPAVPSVMSRLGGWLAGIEWPLALAVLWAAGTFVLLVRLGIANLRTARAIRSRTIEPAPWLAKARRLARVSGVPRTRFVRSETITMPMAAGYLRPTVVLPVEADAWPAERITSVLLHELAHVRRRDCLTQLAASAACALYWMNPLAWYAARALRRERERACDDAVLAAGTAGYAYAEHLIDVARAARHVATPTWSGGVAMAHRSELEGRLMAILDDARNRQSISHGAAGLAGILCLALVTPLAALDPWALGAAAAQAPVAIPPGAGPAPKTPKAPKPGADVPAPTRAPRPEAAAVPPTVVIAGGPGDGIEGGVHGGEPGGVRGGVQVRVEPAVAHAMAFAFSHDVNLESAIVIENDVDGAAEAQGLPTPQATPSPSPSPQPTPAPAKADKDRPRRVEREVKPADPRVIAALGAALKDSDNEVRQQAAHSLGQMRDPAAADALIPALQDADVEVRQNVVHALGQLRDPRAIPGLTIALKDANEEVRQQACFALAQFRDPVVVEPLLIAARDTNSEVRQQALFAIGQIDASRGKDVAIDALKDKDPEVRRAAAHLLGRLARQ